MRRNSATDIDSRLPQLRFGAVASATRPHRIARSMGRRLLPRKGEQPGSQVYDVRGYGSIITHGKAEPRSVRRETDDLKDGVTVSFAMPPQPCVEPISPDASQARLGNHRYRQGCPWPLETELMPDEHSVEIGACETSPTLGIPRDGMVEFRVKTFEDVFEHAFNEDLLRLEMMQQAAFRDSRRLGHRLQSYTCKAQIHCELLGAVEKFPANQLRLLLAKMTLRHRQCTVVRENTCITTTPLTIMAIPTSAATSIAWRKTVTLTKAVKTMPRPPQMA